MSWLSIVLGGPVLVNLCVKGLVLLLRDKANEQIERVDRVS
jgi:hypothetical protein